MNFVLFSNYFIHITLISSLQNTKMANMGAFQKPETVSTLETQKVGFWS